ncbi:Transcriptional regulator, LysR family [Candidatus Rhodobacter oscarellae]|uniref:Transcriptional regulator, LysR family n=1 Tax=Candidatus Rhodobacter oscarellae TaxID=1675527 RepID=A0A0J9E3P6_9RHOB|nr:LysR family transcriptional regulator [Candidatus Rhodobacter lobularis]KMW57327.1 Transcriptional regulator, LysR family [Candidatus Rhodobacter lobularis]
MQEFDNSLVARQLKHFTAIAEAGSLNKAAEMLGIAQPALTRSVRQLEDSIACKLFERGPRGSAITPQGEVLLKYAQRIKSETNLALMAISLLSKQAAPTIQIGVAPAFGLGVLPDAIAGFQSEHPGTKIQIRQAAPAGLIKRLVAAELDLYVGPFAGTPPSSDIVLAGTFEIPSEVYARQDHPLTRMQTVGPAELVEFEWVSLIEEAGTAMPGNWMDELTRLGYEHGLKPPSVAIETTSAINALSIVSKTLCLSCLSSLLRHEAEVRGVTSLALPKPLTNHSTVIAYRQTAQRNPLVMDLVDRVLGLMPRA